MTIAALLSPLAMTAVAQAPRELVDTAVRRASDSAWNVLRYRLNATSQRTPAELAADVALYRRRVGEPLSPALPIFPTDSLRALPVARAHVWLDSVSRIRVAQWRQEPIAGLQLERLAELAVVAREDSFARQQLAARLATPGLSPADRAQALFVGAQAFADRLHPERLPIAEQYVVQLHALGAVALPWELIVRLSLAEDVYYSIGNRDQALAHAWAAVALLPALPHADRRILLDDPGEFVLMMADLLSSTAAGRAQFAKLDTLLFAATLPNDGGWRAKLRTGFAQASLLGKAAPRVLATLWMNTAGATTAPLVRLDDGIVRIVSIVGLVNADLLMGLQRLQTRFAPQVQVIGLATVNGYWGYRFITPAQEAQLQIQAFHELKLTFPIGFWVQDKQLQEDGGVRPPINPTAQDYHMFDPGAFAQLFVIDGHGRVRRAFYGVDRGNEEDIAQLLARFVHEGTRNE